MARPRRTFWVDNTAGSDSNMGTTQDYPFESIDVAVGNIDYRGGPGDTIMIAYTGLDYAFDSGRSPFGEGSHLRVHGTGWDDGEYILVKGYDPNGGNKRPTLGFPSGTTAGSAFGLQYYSNYISFEELAFVSEGANTGWSSNAIYPSSNLSDNITYFRFRRCYFDGLYTNKSTEHQIAFNVPGGARTHLDIQYCFFKNFQYMYKGYTSLPAEHGARWMYNVFYFDDQAGQSFFYPADSTEDENPIDFTYSHNTCICVGASQYTGAMCTFYKGLIKTTTRDKFECKNNFVFWVNYFLRGNSPTACESDITNYVGYNTWGRLNGSTAGYHGCFDICETEGSGRAVGDHNIHFYSQAAGEAILKDVDATTYFWPDSGWMTIPDLRPVGYEMTGTWEDPIDGLRGAIQYSGEYKDTSVDTSHSVYIGPLLSAWDTESSIPSQLVSKGADFTYLISAKDSDTLSFERWGDATTISTKNADVATSGTKVGFTARGQVKLHPTGHETDTWLPVEAWCWGDGGAYDDTRYIGSSKDGNSVTFNIGPGPAPGAWEMHSRVYDISDGTWSDWLMVASWVVV